MNTKMLFAALGAAVLASTPAGATGYYSQPRSKEPVTKCFEAVRSRYGDRIVRMEQRSTATGATVLLEVACAPGKDCSLDEQWIVMCDAESGRIVETARAE